MNILILGAGPTGLGAAYQCDKLGCDTWSLFEREDRSGGLSTSFIDEKGFTWDVGGHVLFSHYDYFDEAVKAALGNSYYEHLRESWIRILNTWVPYPFQNNIRHLPVNALEECLVGLQQINKTMVTTNNFREWIDTVFGKGIVKYFMGPYNSKVWGVPLESMSSRWIRERVSVVDLKRIERNIEVARDDVNWGPNNKFKFPMKGGTGAIFSGIARPFSQHIQYNHKCSRVNLRDKTIDFSNGRRETYDILINTMSLDLFVQLCSDAPENVRMAARELVHNSGLIVGLGFTGKRSDPKCWMYFPEENTPFYRVTNFHNYSPFNVPSGDSENFFSLMCETTYSPHKHVDKNTIVEETIKGLINSGMITEEDRGNIVSRYIIDIPYSYPVPTLGRDNVLKIIQPYLESRGVYSRGRFGAWKYEVGNMDHSFMQGVEVIDRIFEGKEEMTINGKV